MKAFEPLVFAVLAASACVAGGCHTITFYPQQPPITTGGSVERAKVRFNAVTDLDELQGKCLNHDPNFLMYACAYPMVDPLDPKRAVCTVFAFIPEGPREAAKVAILGHEVWHCFGAAHLDARIVAGR